MVCAVSHIDKNIKYGWVKEGRKEGTIGDEVGGYCSPQFTVNQFWLKG
jgi:hypothetical protein